MRDGAGWPHAPCPRVPMSTHSVHLLLYSLRPRTDRVRQALRKRLDQEGGLDIQVQLLESIHSQSTPDARAVQERR